MPKNLHLYPGCVARLEGRALDKKNEVNAIFAKARALAQAREDKDGPGAARLPGRPGSAPPSGVRPKAAGDNKPNPLLPPAWRALQNLQNSSGRGSGSTAPGSGVKLLQTKKEGGLLQAKKEGGLLQAKKEGGAGTASAVSIPTGDLPPPEVLGKPKREKKEKKEKGKKQKKEKGKEAGDKKKNKVKKVKAVKADKKKRKRESASGSSSSSVQEVEEASTTLYIGHFSHPEFGPRQIDTSVKLDGGAVGAWGEATGSWIIMGEVVDSTVTVTYEGKRVTFSDGTIVLDGAVQPDGVVQGEVVMGGMRGGDFLLKPEGVSVATPEEIGDSPSPQSPFDGLLQPVD